MARGLLAAGSLRNLNFIALAALIATGAFHAGRADATRAVSSRRTTPVTEAVRHAAPAVVSVFANNARAVPFSSGATASSRSKMIASTGKVFAFSKARSFELGI